MSTVVAYLFSIVGVFASCQVAGMIVMSIYVFSTRFREIVPHSFNKDEMQQKMQEMFEGIPAQIALVSAASSVLYAIVQFRNLF